MPLYPLKFKPMLLEKMWGGTKIQSLLGKSLPPGKKIGESWELYDFPPGVIEGSSGWVSSQVANGPLAGKTLHELISQFGPAIAGDVPLLEPHGQFPILIKFLDAAQDLSVQVHPDRAYAQSHPGAHLKSEAWYIVQSDPGSRLLKDLVPGTSPQTFKRALESGQIESVIQSIPVKPGQLFYLPSGTVHALGAGILAAEVQTPSDTTFRVYDFNRVDPSTSKPRKLHIEQALQCIDYAAKPLPAMSGGVDCEHFKIEVLDWPAGDFKPIGATLPAVWIVLRGSGRLAGADGPQDDLAPGDTVLFPAQATGWSAKNRQNLAIIQVTFPRTR